MKKKVVSLLLAGVMILGLLAGCGGNDQGTGGDANNNIDNMADNDNTTDTDDTADTDDTTGSDEGNGEIVDINFYISAAAFNDYDRVLAKANEVIEEEIGAHLNLIPLADYTTMQLMIDTGDDWDMCFTSNWLGDYYGNAQKGAFADLTEYLKEGGVASKTYSRIPESLWEGMKVDGKIYGFVNYQIYGSSKQVGLRFRTDIADEVGFDWKALKNADILDALHTIGEDFLTPAMAAHPDMIGWEAQAGSNLYTQAQAAQFFNCEYVGDSVTGSVGWINFDEPTKVFNQYASDDFMEYCKIMRDWYQKGYIPADAATVTDTSADRQAGRYLFELALGWPDFIDFPREEPGGMSMCGSDIAPAGEVSLTNLIMPAGAGPLAAVAVNANSKNIEKCAELMELLNTNDELYVLISNGEEGVDYSWDDEGNLVWTNGAPITNYNEWQIAQSYDDEGFDRMLQAKEGFSEKTDKALESYYEMYAIIYEGDKTAPASPLSGFVFDNSNVTTEIANVTAVVNEMLLSLVTGSVDPEVRIPEFLSRLEAAGVDTIIAEKQAQLDAWNASK